MHAYHNDPRIKAMYLARVEAHRAADQITKGYYWEEGKGCAVGYTIQSSDHATYETELALAYLEDRLFEMQSNAAAMAWPEQFLRAIPVGADLSHVADHLMVWLMEYVTPFANACALPVIQRVQSLYERKVRGAMPTPAEWRAAAAHATAVTADGRASAYAADASASAYAADASASAYAAAAYAYAYASAAAYAAAAYAYAASAVYAARAYADAETISAETISAKLLELLAAAPVPTH